jgi:hypothetical protein
MSGTVVVAPVVGGVVGAVRLLAAPPEQDAAMRAIAAVITRSLGPGITQAWHQ